jgi:hypothetical protein
MCGAAANERQRVSHANGAGRGVPASERVGGPGGEAPRIRIDMREGTKAFLEKRKAEFRGK